MSGLASHNAAAEVEAPPPGLARQIEGCISGMRLEIGGIRELAVGGGRLHPSTETKGTDILHRLMSLASHVTSMECIVSAKRAVGALPHAPRQVHQGELELVAMSADTHDRMLRTLHRAGDDSLDEDTATLNAKGDGE